MPVMLGMPRRLVIRLHPIKFGFDKTLAQQTLAQDADLRMLPLVYRSKLFCFGLPFAEDTLPVINVQFMEQSVVPGYLKHWPIGAPFPPP
jgi:hypothetical protein